jgi:hypothetical protein
MCKSTGLPSSAKLLIATIAAALVFSIPAAATLTSNSQPAETVALQTPVTFAQITAPTLPGDFTVTDNSTSDIFSVADQQINFIYENITGTLPAGLSGEQTAFLTITAISTTPGSINGGIITESGYSGSFSIIRSNPAMNGLSNLLSGTFRTGATISGPVGTTSGTFSDSTALVQTEVVFTSSFISFGSGASESIALSFSDQSAPLALGLGNFLSSFAAEGFGTFGSGPAPEALPEPGSIFSVGIGLLALARFARNRVA